MSLRLLLLQARHPDDPCKAEERSSFAERLKLDESSIVSHDLLDGPPSLCSVQEFDALMMGGSGDFYVSKGDLPGFAGLLEVLREVVEVGHPTFCSCFGFQCMVAALGGKIVHDPGSTEVGTFALELTEEGRRDPLLGTLPNEFLAQLGRKDRASLLPEGVYNLATSQSCPFQALRIPGKPIWATQFHPELDKETNLGRYLRYKDGYAEHLTAEERQEAMSTFRESPEACSLLPRFVELVFS